MRCNLKERSIAIGLLVLAAACGLAAMLLLVLTNPKTLGPYGVTAWFILVLIAITCCVAGFLFWVKGKIGGGYTGSKRLLGSLRQGFLLGLTATIFLALSSLRQLSLRDVILVGIFMLLTEFYFRARS